MTSSQPLRVAVIGAGPAGLGALLALRKVEGVDVQVYEQAQKLREIGAVRQNRRLVRKIMTP